MKNTLSFVCTLLAGFLLSTSSFAQTNTLFNPDYNGDGFIGVDDILGALSVYDNAWEGPVSLSWTCGEAITYVGVDYSTVLIGDQCWFAENLRTKTYLNGDAIPQNLSDAEWSSTTSGAMAFYADGPAYGGLYNGYTVYDARGLCPSGWHVPTDGEWMTLEMALGMTEVEANDGNWRGTDQGTQMKTDYGWYNGGNGTNSSSFSGLPGGYRYNDGSFHGAGDIGHWWSSSPYGPSAWSRRLQYNNEYVYRMYFQQRLGFSVRCVQDAE